MLKVNPAILSAILLPSLVSSHFQLNYPTVRGYDEDKLGTFPCGSQDTVSSKRTQWPLAGGPIHLNMEHDHAAVQVLLGLGNDVGDNFNIVLLPTIQEEGIGTFCLDDVAIPSSLNLKDGQNATLQVVTNGDPNGGLYNCADITLTSASLDIPPCHNNTGVTATNLTKYNGKNANGTDVTPGSESTPSPSPSASGSQSSSATSSSSTGTATATGSGSGSGSGGMGRGDGMWGVGTVVGVVVGVVGVGVGVWGMI